MTDSSGGNDADRCLTCGDDLADSAHRRVITAVEDGRVVSRAFCDEACLVQWRE